jgi:tetratricopeptide (TPR) repeat protein
MVETNPMARKKRKKLIKTIIIVALIAIAAPFAMPAFALFAGSSSGYQDFVIGKLQACQHARALLGEDVGPSYVGLAWGSSETEGGMHGHAQWHIPVSGSRGRGSYDYALELHGGQWSMLHAQLDVDGQLVDIASCTSGGVAVGGGGSGSPQALQAAQAAGQCYQQGNMECALNQSQAACNLGHTGSCGNAAHLLLTLRGDAAGAAQMARMACTAGSASGCENLGTALRKLGDVNGAYQAMSQSCTMQLDVGCSILANMDLERGDTATAAQSANRALKLNPNRSSAFRQLGHAYLFGGQVEQALGYYQRAVQTAPIADQGRDVVEDAKEPPLTLIQNEITALSKVFPQSAAAVQQVWPRLPALAGGAAR